MSRGTHEHDDGAANESLPAIPATGWAILGLLSFDRELSGYELKQWADSILALFYWSPATSQIYTELRRLERLGLVTSREVARDGSRDKRVYAITRAGTTALRTWQAEVDAEPTVLKHGLLVRLWLGHLAEPDRLREQILRHRATLEAELVEAERSLAGSGDAPERAFAQLVIEWNMQRVRDEISLTERMLTDIDRLGSTRAHGEPANDDPTDRTGD